MSPRILKIGFFMAIYLSSYGAQSQVFENDEGDKEKHFIYEVKQIDEFFERFNNDSSSFIRGVYKSYHVKYNIPRSRLIKSLFNYETKSWDTMAINSFVTYVTDNKSPYFLNFYGDNWYAELECKFQYQGSAVTIPLVLKIVTGKNRGAKWVIVAVGPNPVKSTITVTKMPESKNLATCISPSSHAASFLTLKKAFADKDNLPNCFESTFFDKPNALEFYNAILNDQIDFLYVKVIKYHFLQTGKWIFRVEYFPREALNSGWLISYMKRVSPPEMEIYKQRLLGYSYP
jgi:hypothetical protein